MKIFLNNGCNIYIYINDFGCNLYIYNVNILVLYVFYFVNGLI